MVGIRYLRVSTDDQEGGLAMQDSVTKSIAEKQGIEIIATFQDEAISGASNNRAGFNALKSMIKNYGSELNIVVYDMSRIGRDVTIGEEFIQLCWKTNTGVIDRTGTRHTFDSHEKRLFARIMFAFNSADREKKNGDTMAGMKNALEEGRWIFGTPKGYVYSEQYIDKLNGKRKVLTPHPVNADVIAEALNNFALGIFTTQIEVFEHLQKHKIPASRNEIRGFLANPLYAGLVEYKPWGIQLRQGLHPALISIEIHEKILEKLKTKEKLIFKASLASDFPFRRYTKCALCDRYLSACWITGKSKKYKSYFCQNKKCDDYKKHLNGDVLESQFLKLLESIKVSTFVLDTAKEVFNAQWAFNQGNLEKTRKNQFIELKKIDTQIEKLFNKLKETESKILTQKLENEIEKLENDKIKIGINIKQISNDQVIDETKYLTLVNKAFALLENPDKLWINGSLEMKRLVIELLLGGCITVSTTKKHLTPHLSQFYQLICSFDEKNLIWCTNKGVISNTANTLEDRIFQLIVSIKPHIESVNEFDWVLV